jgi:hypothetical protein
MVRYVRGLGFAVLLLCFAGFAVAGQIACDNDNFTFTSTQDVVITGTISPGAFVYGELASNPDQLINPTLPLNGTSGSWKFNLGKRTASDTLTIYAYSDTPSHDCPFTVSKATPGPDQKKIADQPEPVSVSDGGAIQHGAKAEKKHDVAGQVMVRITDVGTGTVGRHKFVQVRGTVCGGDASLKLAAHVFGEVWTDQGTQQVQAAAKKVYASKVAGTDGLDVFAEINVSYFPPGTYSVRLLDKKSGVTANRFKVVKIGNTVAVAD